MPKIVAVKRFLGAGGKLAELRRSRCAVGQSPSLTWHYWCEPRQPSPVMDEIKAVFEGCNEAQRIDRYAAITQRLQAAAAGDLFEENEEEWPPLKPVQRDPSLWEIRWDLDGAQWRLYHAEPGDAPGFLIALRFHQKDLAGSHYDIRDAQNSHIDTATRRYDDGRRSMWGLP